MTFHAYEDLWGKLTESFPASSFRLFLVLFFCSSSHCLCFVLAGGQLACTTFTLYKTPLPRIRGEGGRLLELLCPSVRPSVRQSNRVRSVSPDPLNHFLPNLVWCCIIMRRCVMQKNWFTSFSVKVTARVYIIKIWLFLLYLLNCWSVCNQT